MLKVEAVFDLSSTTITEGEHQTVKVALQKLAFCAKHHAPIGPDLFEERSRMQRSTSLELAAFDKEGRIYLGERDSLAVNLYEPYPGMIGLLGTTINVYDTWQRCIERVMVEYGGGVLFQNLRWLPLQDRDGFPLLVHDEPRGMYQPSLFTCTLVGTPSSRGRFYEYDEIPWNRLIKSHREVYILAAFRTFLNEIHNRR